MAQRKTGAKLKSRRIPEGHPSPADYYAKIQMNSTTSQFEELDLKLFPPPPKIAFIPPPQPASYNFSFCSLESIVPIISKNCDSLTVKIINRAVGISLHHRNQLTKASPLKNNIKHSNF